MKITDSLAFKGRVIINKNEIKRQFSKLDEDYRKIIAADIEAAVITVKNYTPEDRVYDLEIYVANDKLPKKENEPQQETQSFYYIFTDVMEAAKNPKNAYAHSDPIITKSKTTYNDSSVVIKRYPTNDIWMKCIECNSDIVDKLKSIAAKSEYGKNFTYDKDSFKNIIDDID